VFQRTEGKDGYVSIEVAPRLANDTPSTIHEARRLWSTVNRPNLMVKIPATAAGVPAIEQSIADGLNINVTLIFSLKRYDEVMDAYLRGLIRRLESGQKIDGVASVASFFVSRVDTLVDKLLEEKIAGGAEKKDLLQSLKGKAAIANAKLAYAEFRRKFSTEAFASLKNHGANLQRPLWASTSTKNPAYPDVYYVEALVGPDTVDTMPPATLTAYKDHGNPEPRLAKDLDDARRVMDQLAEVGVSMDAVTKKLEEDGVASFTKSFDSLIAVVEKRRAQNSATRGAPAEARERKAGAKRTASSGKARARRGSAKKAAAKKNRPQEDRREEDAQGGDEEEGDREARESQSREEIGGQGEAQTATRGEAVGLETQEAPLRAPNGDHSHLPRPSRLDGALGGGSVRGVHGRRAFRRGQGAGGSPGRAPGDRSARRRVCESDGAHARNRGDPRGAPRARGAGSRRPARDRPRTVGANDAVRSREPLCGRIRGLGSGPLHIRAPGR
jgi:transaldolase